MATLLAVYNSEGCVGRCDAKCYNAECTHCDCICGGLNHGAGLAKAAANTAELADAMIEKWKETHLEDEHKFKVAPMQKDLWGDWHLCKKPKRTKKQESHERSTEPTHGGISRPVVEAGNGEAAHESHDGMFSGTSKFRVLDAPVAALV
jgi:hypothetical protein